MELLDFIDSVYRLVRPDCGDKALLQVRSVALQLRKQFSRDIMVDELSKHLVCSHLRWMLDSGKSPQYVNRRRGHLLTLWKVAYQEELNSNNYWAANIPCVRSGKRVPVAWPVKDIKAMLIQADLIQSLDFGAKCWSALIQLIYFTGLRIRSVMLLERNHLHGHVLVVPPGIQKDKEEMAFRLPGSLVNLLVSLPRPAEVHHGRLLSEMLLPWPWRLDRIQDKFAKHILRPAGLIANDRRLKFHAIRRTVATIIAAKEGKDAAKAILGHSSLKVTEAYLVPDPSTIDPSLPTGLCPIDVMPHLFEAS